MDRCVKIILNSYGIVVALVPSLYYSLFLKKKIVFKRLPVDPVLHFDPNPKQVCVWAHYTERGLYLRDVQ